MPGVGETFQQFIVSNPLPCPGMWRLFHAFQHIWIGLYPYNRHAARLHGIVALSENIAVLHCRRLSFRHAPRRYARDQDHCKYRAISGQPPMPPPSGSPQG
ncbi:MAG: hypothetical protein ABSH08_10835 [Tepidisphaeraceae bacterium]